MTEYELANEVGKAIGAGIFNQLALMLVFCLIIALPVGWVVNQFTPTDTTDFSKQKRSGVKIVTDAATGIEYLVTPQGGITPRIKE